MKHLKKFNEDLEPELINAINYIKKNKGLNNEEIQKNRIMKVIKDNYKKSDTEISKILGLSLTEYEKKINRFNLSNFKKEIIERNEKDEDLNLERNEIKHITDVIIKNYDKTYPEIADILGIPIRTFFTKLKDYDLEDLRKQVKKRGGKGWNHPYNKIDPNED